MEPASIALYPTPEQLEALLAGPADQPVVMLNLLRFKARGDAPDDDVSGEDAYRRYMADMLPFIAERGARVLWSGVVNTQVIGKDAAGFHHAALVEYPSRKIFVEIATSPQVQRFGVHRAAGLEGQWLLATTTDT